MSHIPVDLLAAYRATNFVIVLPGRELNLSIGHTSSELTEWHLQQQAAAGAYITAWNPHSQTTEKATNEAANQCLLATITRAGLRYFPCDGRDPSEQWPNEPGFWILDADRRWLRKIGRRFRQNALVVANNHARPALLCLR